MQITAELLAKREAVYERAKSLNPKRWSGDIRNWTAAGAVSLNPGKLQEIERNKQAAKVQLFGQLGCKSPDLPALFAWCIFHGQSPYLISLGLPDVYTFTVGDWVASLLI